MEVIATANPKDVFLLKPDDAFKAIRSGHESISQTLNPAQKATVTLLDVAKKTPAAETEVKQEQQAQKISKVRL